MKKILTVLMSAFFLLGCLSPMAVVATGEEGPIVYFEDDFGSAVVGSEDYVAPQAVATSTSEGYGKWRLTGNVYETAKSQGTEANIIVDPDDETNNILHMSRTTTGSDPIVHLILKVIDLPQQATTDQVVFSFKMKFDQWYHKFNFDSPFAASLRNDYVSFGSATFTPANDAQLGAVRDTNVWHDYKLVVNYTAGTTTLYIDEIQIGDSHVGTMQIASITPYQPRYETYGKGNVYLDDFKLEWIPDPDVITLFGEFNPATKGGLYVDKDLDNVVNILGEDYEVTYESSDYGVIAADGTVTIPDVFTTVTVRPSIVFEGTKVLGKTTVLSVLPAGGTVRFFDSFDHEGAVSGQKFFGDSGQSKGAWYTPSGAGYITYYNNGFAVDYFEENGDMAMKLVKPGRISGNDYEVAFDWPSIEASAGDIMIFSYRAKSLDGSGICVCSPYFGQRDIDGNWYGNYCAGAYDGYNISSYLSTEGVWRNFVYVVDRKNIVTKDYGECYPVSLYIDGNFIGTSYIKTTGNDEVASRFQFRQWGYQSYEQNALLDDIMIMHVNDGAIQFGSSTVANGKLIGAKIQYNAYAGDAKSGVVFAAAYDSNDVMVAVSTGVAATANIGGGYTDVTFDLNLAGASYYRLFFFNSEAGLQPIMNSKTIPVQ